MDKLDFSLIRGDVSYARLRVLSEAVVHGEVDPEVLAEQFRTLLADAPRRAIHVQLERSRAACRAHFAGSPSLTELESELTRLERYDG